MANTYPTPKRIGRADAITGAGLYYKNITITNDAATSAVLHKEGYAMTCIQNDSGAAVTITWYGSCDSAGPFNVLQGEDAAGSTNVIGANHVTQEGRAFLASCPHLVPVASVDSAVISVYFSR